jgi:hypothetical protein
MYWNYDFIILIRRGFAPGYINYKKGCTRLAGDKVYQLLADGRWFSPGKTGRHDIAEILLKVALNAINQSINHLPVFHLVVMIWKKITKYILIQIK